MFGGDWCGWCHKLHALFKSDIEIRKILSYEYVLMMVDTEAPNAVDLFQEVQGRSEQGRAREGRRLPLSGRAYNDAKVVTALRARSSRKPAAIMTPLASKEFLTRNAVTPSQDAGSLYVEGLRACVRRRQAGLP